MDLFETIAARHSFRAYQPRPVAREDLERMVDAARLAPSAMNSQPWKFHIATGETRERVDAVMERTTVYLDEYLTGLGAQDRVAAATRFMGNLGGAPVVIAVSAPRAGDEVAQVNTLVAVGTAIENLLLAATALGLATCNVTFSYWVRDELAEVFEVGTARYVVSVIAVGYADETPRAPSHDADIAVWYE
jgi:nitroreductase